MQPVGGYHAASGYRRSLGDHSRDVTGGVTVWAAHACALDEGHAWLDPQGLGQERVEAQPPHPEPPGGAASRRAWKRGRRAEGLVEHAVGDRLQPGCPVRQQGVEEAEAAQHRHTARHQALATRLVPGEAGSVEDEGPMSGTGQKQGGGHPAGAGSDHHHVGVLGAHRPILPDGDAEPRPAVVASVTGGQEVQGPVNPPPSRPHGRSALGVDPCASRRTDADPE